MKITYKRATARIMMPARPVWHDVELVTPGIEASGEKKEPSPWSQEWYQNTKKNLISKLQGEPKLQQELRDTFTALEKTHRVTDVETKEHHVATRRMGPNLMSLDWLISAYKQDPIKVKVDGQEMVIKPMQPGALSKYLKELATTKHLEVREGFEEGGGRMFMRGSSDLVNTLKEASDTGALTASLKDRFVKLFYYEGIGYMDFQKKVMRLKNDLQAAIDKKKQEYMPSMT